MSQADKAKLLRRATYASVLTASALIVLKLAAWLWTGSVSILASLIDSLMDSIASIINLLAVRYSLMPPDEEHRFGHGKAEPLAALAQAAFICGSELFFGVERHRSTALSEIPWVATKLKLMKSGKSILNFQWT